MNQDRTGAKRESFIAIVDVQHRITIPRNVREYLKIEKGSTVRATVELLIM